MAAMVEAVVRHSQFLQGLEVVETLRVNSLDFIHIQVPEEEWMVNICKEQKCYT